eukprot:15425484-Heterocapsa_arctica.AAC.1
MAGIARGSRAREAEAAHRGGGVRGKLGREQRVADERKKAAREQRRRLLAADATCLQEKIRQRG